MSRCATVPIGLALVAFAAAGLGAEPSPESCLSYEPDTISISGKLERRTYPGRPNYESVAAGDEPEVPFYVVVEVPICTKVKEGQRFSVALTGVQLVQLNLTPDQYKQLSVHLGKKVAFTGRMYEGQSGHHHALVVMYLEKLANVG